MQRHPVAYARVIGFAAGELHGADAAALVAHVATCPDCAAVIRRYRAAQLAVRADHAAQPPAATVDAAKAIFPRSDPPPAPSPAVEPLCWLIARLVPNGNGGLAPSGVRGAAGSFRAHYESDEPGGDVELQAGPPAGRRQTADR